MACKPGFHQGCQAISSLKLELASATISEVAHRLVSARRVR
jgi:hypothetical protein